MSLALGIGANAAIFSMFDQLLRRPLPVRESGRLVNLSAPGPKPGSDSCNQSGSCEEVFSYAMMRDLEKANVFEQAQIELLNLRTNLRSGLLTQ